MVAAEVVGTCVCVCIVQGLRGAATGFRNGLNTGLSTLAAANSEFGAA